MRLFIGIDFDSQVKKALDMVRLEVEKISKKGGYYTKPLNYHLTLKFIGEASPMELDDILKSMVKTAKRSEPFNIEFSDIGFFKRENGIIPYINIVENKSLISLYKTLDNELSKCGFKKEIRRFTPHITLGRGVNLLRGRNELSCIPVNIPIQRASSIVLMESLRDGGRLIYKKIEEINLQENKQDQRRKNYGKGTI